MLQSYHHKPKVQGVDYSSFIMVMMVKSLEKMERLMKRCSPEWRRRPAAAHGGGGGPWGRRRRPLAAAAALGDEDGVEEVLLPQTAAWEEENSWSWVPLTT